MIDLDLAQFTERFIDDITVTAEKDAETGLVEVHVYRYITRVNEDGGNNYWSAGSKFWPDDPNLEQKIRATIDRLKAERLPDV